MFTTFILCGKDQELRLTSWAPDIRATHFLHQQQLQDKNHTRMPLFHIKKYLKRPSSLLTNEDVHEGKRREEHLPRTNDERVQRGVWTDNKTKIKQTHTHWHVKINVQIGFAVNAGNLCENLSKRTVGNAKFKILILFNSSYWMRETQMWMFGLLVGFLLNIT